MKPSALPGFRDFYPETAIVRTRIFNAWRAVAGRYGFDEYDGPPLEALDLYTQKSGPEIVEQLYHFTDKGGREVALRPEMTPTLARMVAAHARALKKPIRWFSLPQLFRYERQQKGRLREHFQLNMDLIGETGPMADAEIIAASLDVMRELGLGPEDVRVRVSDRRVMKVLLGAAGVTDDQLSTALAAVDKIERDPAEALVAMMKARGLSGDVAGMVLEIGKLRGMDALRAALEPVPGGEEALEPLEQCIAALDALGFGDFVDVDCSIVRGLAYYTGIVFELFDAQRTLRAICGGGRYDGLLEALGGVDLPAVGFGMGDVVLAELLKDRGGSDHSGARLDVFVVAVTAADVAEVLRIAAGLRGRGARVEYALRHQSVAKQMKLAAARPARWAVVVGPDERAAGEVVARDLASGKESRMAVRRFVDDDVWRDPIEGPAPVGV